MNHLWVLEEKECKTKEWKRIKEIKPFATRRDARLAAYVLKMNKHLRIKIKKYS